MPKTIRDIPILSQGMRDRFAELIYERMTAPSPFQTKHKIKEMVPRYYIRVPVPYIRLDREDREFRIGFQTRTLFTLGKVEQERFLMTWELKAHGIKEPKQNVLKFKRYGKLDDKN